MTQQIEYTRGNTLKKLRVTLREKSTTPGVLGTPIALTGSATLEAAAAERNVSFQLAGTFFDAPNGKVDFEAVGNQVTADAMGGEPDLVLRSMVKLIDGSSKVGYSEAFNIRISRAPVTP